MRLVEEERVHPQLVEINVYVVALGLLDLIFERRFDLGKPLGEALLQALGFLAACLAPHADHFAIDRPLKLALAPLEAFPLLIWRERQPLEGVVGNEDGVPVVELGAGQLLRAPVAG